MNWSLECTVSLSRARPAPLSLALSLLVLAATGTEPVADLCPGPCGPTSLSDFAAGDTRAYFVAWHYRFVEIFYEVWTTDGTSGDLVRLQELCGECGSTIGPRAHGGRIYFTVIPKDGGSLPWASDGTAAGTRPLLPESLASSERGINQSFEIDGTVYLVLGGPLGEPHLWRTDGTPEGTERLPVTRAASSSPAELTPFGGRLWFTALTDDGDPTATELWRTTEEGASYRPSTPFTFDNGQPMVVARGFTEGPGGLVFFTTFGLGEELWVTDGTAAGTRLLVDVYRAGRTTARNFDRRGFQVD